MKNTILIIDDTPQNIQVLATILSEQEYDIEYALSGKEGVNILAVEPIDLILLDIMMPEMDGFEVCRIIRQQAKYNEVPIIFLTAKTDKDSMYEGFELGAQDFVSKPFDQRELLARIKTHLELRNSRNQLKNMNSFLEEEVEKRTLELKNSNLKLEKANAELIGLDTLKSDFLTIISHQIRTPLNGISGALQLLKHHVESIKLSKFIDLLDVSTSRLEKFSFIALRITSLKSGKYKINQDIINLNELIELCAVNLSDAAVEKNVKINLKEPNEKLELIGDYELINYCMESVLQYSIFYTPPGTTVSISLKSTPSSIEVLIEDHGSKYSEDQLANLFKLFNSVSDADKSAGLGLPFAELILEAHKSTIEVFNNPDIGTTIKIVFALNSISE